MKKTIIAGAAVLFAAYVVILLLPSPREVRSQEANAIYDLLYFYNNGKASNVTVSALESSHVLRTAPTTFYGGSINTQAASLWVMLVDGTVAPSNGAVTGCGDTFASRTTGCIVKWWQVPSIGTFGVQAQPAPMLAFGAVLACSSTGPFTFTASAQCTFSAEAK